MTKGHKKGDKIEAVEIVTGRSVVPFELQVSMATDLACDRSLNTHTRIEFSPSALLCMLHPCPTQIFTHRYPCLLPFPPLQPDRPGRVRDSAARSESAGSTRYSRDPSQPGRSESASLIRVARVSRFDPNQSRPESAVSIRVSQLDPSRLARFEPVQTHPCPCPVQSLASPSSRTFQP